MRTGAIRGFRGFLAHLLVLAPLLLAVSAATTIPADEAPNCITVDACGPTCQKCAQVPFSTVTCDKNATGVHACSWSCNTNFKAVSVNGQLACEPSRLTGLQMEYEGLSVQSPINCTRRGKRCTRAISSTVANLGTPLSAEELARAACNESDVYGLECFEGLLLSLTPTKYSANVRADTPGGRAMIRPAQDQLECASCAAFAMTAAAEAAINAYFQQDWNMTSLSEQEFFFCRLSASCFKGTSFERTLQPIKYQEVTRWASRRCFTYTGRPASGLCSNKGRTCTSALPTDGVLSVALDGYPLDTPAYVKRQIMLNGGVVVAVEVPDKLYDYPRGSRKGIYTVAAGSAPGNLHALFCYGWEDFPSINEQNLNEIDGYWICKNSWGTRWGLGGNVKIAYGAAGILEPYPAYGLQFGPYVPDINSTKSTMQQGLSYDSPRGCIAFTPRQPMRLIKLVADVWTLLLEANSASVDERVILAELVAANLALKPLSAISKGPFRMCGTTAEMVAKTVGMQPPEGLCSDIPYSFPTAAGKCICKPGSKADYTNGSLKACQPTSSGSGVDFCSGGKVKVVNDFDRPIGCLEPGSTCPGGYTPLYRDAMATPWQCHATRSSCTYNGHTIALTSTRITTSSGAVLDGGKGCSTRTRACSLNLIDSLGGAAFLSSVNYTSELFGCLETSSNSCPAGYVAFRSSSNSFKVELCTQVSMCYTPSSTLTISPPDLSTFTTPALNGNRLLACLDLAGGGCPPMYPRNITYGGLKACSTQ